MQTTPTYSISFLRTSIFSWARFSNCAGLRSTRMWHKAMGEKSNVECNASVFPPDSLRSRILIWAGKQSLPPRRRLPSLWLWRMWCVRSARTQRCSCLSTTPWSPSSSGKPVAACFLSFVLTDVLTSSLKSFISSLCSFPLYSPLAFFLSFFHLSFFHPFFLIFNPFFVPASFLPSQWLKEVLIWRTTVFQTLRYTLNSSLMRFLKFRWMDWS